MNRAALPFTALGVAAIVASGLSAAAIAHRPTQPLVWMVAYLTLVVGVGQYVLGLGQARLGDKAPSRVTVWSQWLLLNAGHAGVIAGSLLRNVEVVAVATVPYVLALAWFGMRVRRQAGGRLILGYRAIALLLLASSLVGVGLSAWLF